MSNIQVLMKCDEHPVTWQEFRKEALPNSIALDGYVKGESKFDICSKTNASYANFNHHEDVNRYATRSTCAQILLAIRSKLLNAYRNEKGNIHMNVYVNDCDEDVCLSVYLLKNAYLFENTANPRLNRLVSFEDMLDTTSGTYAFPRDLPFLREVGWIFEPYREARLNGVLSRKNPTEYLRILSDVERRISSHIMGSGGSIELNTSYEKIGGGKGWSMVKEIGSHARIGMISDNIDAFVSVQERQDGRFSYVIGKASPYIINFNIPEMFSFLNEAEGCVGDIWGGSDTIGGSPRVSGSSLNPNEVEKIINEYLVKK